MKKDILLETIRGENYPTEFFDITMPGIPTIPTSTYLLGKWMECVPKIHHYDLQEVERETSDEPDKLDTTITVST